GRVDPCLRLDAARAGDGALGRGRGGLPLVEHADAPVPETRRVRARGQERHVELVAVETVQALGVRDQRAPHALERPGRRALFLPYELRGRKLAALLPGGHLELSGDLRGRELGA